MKIAIGGFHIESCTFSPLISRAEDFHVLRAAALLKNYPFLADYPEITFVPIVHARALPGGPVDRPFYEQIKAEFLLGLAQNGPWDGVFVPLHGAVYVDGLEDAEGDLLDAIRSAVGPDCLIASCYDLHGNVSPRVFASLDLISAYRAAPHVDVYESLRRTCALLIRCLREKIHPVKAFIPVPILLPGEQTSTEWEPAHTLYAGIPGVISGAVMDASILIGYVWADEPRATAAVLAYGTDRSEVDQAARTLAQRFWDVRLAFNFGVTTGSVDHCLQLAAEAPERPVVISDSGDNPTAGGAGDTPYVLERMLALGVSDGVIAGIADAAAVAQCEKAGVGQSVALTVGGKLDPIHAQPAAFKGTVRSLHNLPWSLNRTGDASITNRIAVVEAQGLLVVLTQRRTTFHRLVDFTNLGINPHEHKIVVVKIGYLEPELKAMAARALLAFSPGAVNQAITSLPYKRIRRPMFPFDPQMAWEPPI